MASRDNCNLQVAELVMDQPKDRAEVLKQKELNIADKAITEVYVVRNMCEYKKKALDEVKDFYDIVRPNYELFFKNYSRLKEKHYMKCGGALIHLTSVLKERLEKIKAIKRELNNHLQERNSELQTAKSEKENFSYFKYFALKVWSCICDTPPKDYETICQEVIKVDKAQRTINDFYLKNVMKFIDSFNRLVALIMEIEDDYKRHQKNLFEPDSLEDLEYEFFTIKDFVDKKLNFQMYYNAITAIQTDIPGQREIENMDLSYLNKELEKMTLNFCNACTKNDFRKSFSAKINQ